MNAKNGKGFRERMRKIGIGLVFVVGGFLTLQIVPLERDNPPVNGDLHAPPAIKMILRRACYDCHSNQTVWPWYSAVAPVSWLVSDDVEEGREELNFSRWRRYSKHRRSKKYKEIAKVLHEGEMPPWYYLPMHPRARLSADEVKSVVRWAKKKRRKLARRH